MNLTHLLNASALAAVAVSAAFAMACGGAFAQLPAPAASEQSAPPAGAGAPRSVGEVRKVDREQGKVTLRHGPLQNLDMPPMTMVFKVSDPKMLDKLKEGDKVNFTADKVNGAFVVTALEPAAP